MKRTAPIAVAIGCATLLLGACGGDDGGGGARPVPPPPTVAASVTAAPVATTAPVAATTPQRPEDVIAPLTEVKIKLPALVTLGNQASAQAQAGDWDGANDAYESLINIWFEVEGAVGDTDQDIYERSETAQGLISDGIENENAQRVATGAADQQAAIQQFLDTYTT